MKEFLKGQRIKTVSGRETVVHEKLGEFPRGMVYEVLRAEPGNGHYVLKWYFHGPGPRPGGSGRAVSYKNFRERVRRKIRKGAPSGDFLWPVDIAKPRGGRYGYMTHLIPPNYKNFSAFLRGDVLFDSVHAITEAALGVVNAFEALHRKRFCFCDLDESDLFIDPQSGRTLLTGENVGPCDKKPKTACTIGYMAPGVVSGRELPGVYTDRFSMAVLLFRLLFGDHPLEGKRATLPCLTGKLKRDLYGTGPVFVYDPEDDSNRPARGVHVNLIKRWPLYPEFVKNAFIRAFSGEAMTGRGAKARADEKEWGEIFTKLRDVAVWCSCGRETFIDLESPASKCINCGANIAKPPELRFKKRRIALFPSTKLYHDRQTAGEVVRHNLYPDRWAIRNDSGLSWTVIDPAGSNKTIGRGQAVPIIDGLKISFGGLCDAEIRTE
ncbi:MAG: hypothetical protein LBQ90_03955 [Synergistaceae bacterium]|nr:hypothetical protein [Synergistaceae bacterium]